MEKDKSKNIKFFANELSNADRDIDIVKRIGNYPFLTLNVNNGTGGYNQDLIIWEGLKKPLMEFLLSHFKKEKQKIYDKLSKELLKK